MTHIDATWYRRLPNVPTRIDAGGVVARLDGEAVLVALAREDAWPLYILPKGGVETGESLDQAARREIAEEAGLSELQLLGKLGVRERLSHDKRRWNVVHYFLFTTRQVLGAPTDPEHSYGVSWHPLRALPEMLWPEQLELIRTNVDRIEQLVRQAGR